jgi:leucyl-tRNA synthetase
VDEKEIDKDALKKSVLLLTPFAPFLCEDLWNVIGEKAPLATAAWPTYDPALVQDETVTVAIQVNGKTRGTVIAAKDATQAQVHALAEADEKLQKHITGKTIAKAVYVPGRILNLIIR